MTAPARLSAAEAAFAGAPPERVGLPRDGVRLMVATAGRITHTTFNRIGDFLEPGDVLVVNVSRTIPASLDGVDADGTPVRIHLSCPISPTLWTVEPRQPDGVGSHRWPDFPGGTVRLPGGAAADLLTRDVRSPRLWVTDSGGSATWAPIWGSTASRSVTPTPTGLGRCPTTRASTPPSPGRRRCPVRAGPSRPGCSPRCWRGVWCSPRSCSTPASPHSTRERCPTPSGTGSRRRRPGWSTRHARPGRG
nr:MAG: hypothetical protein DIU67_11175 [Actinomycetota bacterium]